MSKVVAPDPVPAARRWISALPLLLAFALSAGVAVLALLPALAEPGAWLVGSWEHPDTLSNHWLLAWVGDQLSAGQGILHNTRYYWPVGDAPMLAGNGAEGFLYLPFHMVLGWPEAVPWYLLLVLVLNGMAGYALARAAGAGRWASLVAIGFTGASPFVFQELSAGRFSQASIGWLLFFLAAWLRFLARPSYRGALVSGLLLAITSFFYWYYGWFGVLAGAIFLLARGRQRPPASLLGLFAGAFLVPISPWLLLFVARWAGIPGTDEDVFPHPHAVLDSATALLPVQVGPGREAGRAMPLPLWLLGLGGALLAVSSLFRPGRIPRWLAAGLLGSFALFQALCYGPAFVAAPYMLYGLVGPLQRFWWPLRHVVVVNASWAVLAALALSALAAFLRRERPRGLKLAPLRRLRPWQVELLVAALAIGAVLSARPLLAARGLPDAVPLSRMHLPPRVYPELGALEPGVLLEPPLAPDVASAQQHLLYQRWHGKPLLSGHALWVDRVRPDDWDAFVEKSSFLSEMQRLERGEIEDGVFDFESRDLQALVERDLRWVALNREYFPFALREVVRAYDEVLTTLFGEPILRDKGIKVWDARRWTGTARVEIPPVEWPAELRRPGPDQPVEGRRPMSMVFGGESDE